LFVSFFFFFFFLFVANPCICYVFFFFFFLGVLGGGYFLFFIYILLKCVDKEESNGRRSKDERCTTPFSLFGKVFLGLVLLFLFKCVDEKA